MVSDIDIEVRHAPSFGVARCRLSGGEQLKVESGAMMAHSIGMALEAKSIQSIDGSQVRGGVGVPLHASGPGDIMVQTRNQQQLIAWINTEIGSRE